MPIQLTAAPDATILHSPWCIPLPPNGCSKSRVLRIGLLLCPVCKPCGLAASVTAASLLCCHILHPRHAGSYIQSWLFLRQNGHTMLARRTRKRGHMAGCM